MKILLLACAGAFVVGLAIGRPASTVISTAPLSSGLESGATLPDSGAHANARRSAETSGSTVAQGVGPATGDATPTVEAAPLTSTAPATVEPTPPPPRRSNSRRRSRRNRYPGPIPTPADWEPPPGPVRIGLQAGHWRANEAPAELRGLRDNGTRWGGMREWQANLEIAERARGLLEELGYEVDVLPAVVPPSYRAHLFIAIHADGSNDPSARGYRVAAPGRDATGRASEIAQLLATSYGQVTGIRRLEDTTRRMRNYYAFNYRRYEHALHPMTIAVIIETGFLTSARDRRVIVDAPDRAARGIVEAVRAFHVTPPPVRSTQTEDNPPP